VSVEPSSFFYGIVVASAIFCLLAYAIRKRRATRTLSVGHQVLQKSRIAVPDTAGPLADLVDVSLCPYTDDLRSHTGFDLSDQQQDTVTRALLATGQAGQAALNAAVAGTSLVQMTLRAPLAQSVASGTAQMMPAAGGGFHGAVLGSGGISGQAVFSPASALRAAAGLAAV